MNTDMTEDILKKLREIEEATRSIRLILENKDAKYPKEMSCCDFFSLPEFNDGTRRGGSMVSRARNAMMNWEICFVSDLMEFTKKDLLKKKFIGKATVNFIEKCLEKHGLSLRPS